jgi:uncharacterized paraquat-inducible protein A
MMPKLPLVAWIVAAVVGLLLCALCATTIYAIARRSARSRVERWPASRLFLLLVVAAVPWLVVRLAPIKIEIAISGRLQLTAWILAALLCFVLLVVLPLAALTSVAAWWAGRRRPAPVP